MKKVAIFVDVQNVYYTAKQAFGKNYDYNKFWQKATYGRKVTKAVAYAIDRGDPCLLYTSPSPRDATLSRMPSSA